MKILIACEYSGIVANAFASLGHDVTSCDLLAGDNVVNHKHYQGSVMEIINLTWDMLIGFPPCTYLCKAQNHRYGKGDGREQLRTEAVQFFLDLYNFPGDKVAIENPVGYMNKHFRLPNQIVRPWHFGDPYNKDICFWTRNLPPLISTCYSIGRKSVSNHVNGRMNQIQKSKIKSRFFPMLAEQMALQWS